MVPVSGRCHYGPVYTNTRWRPARVRFISVKISTLKKTNETEKVVKEVNSMASQRKKEMFISSRATLNNKTV